MAALVALALTLYAIGDDGAPTPVPVEEPTSQAADVEASPSPEIYQVVTVWDRLAQCESSGDWHIRGRIYSGGLQMDSTFWSRYGGRAYAPSPDLATRVQQIAVAERGLAVQGWGAWPYCSRHLGLR